MRNIPNSKIGKPALSATSWAHPAGPKGEDLEISDPSGPGDIRCEESQVDEVLNRLKSEKFASKLIEKSLNEQND